MDKLYKKVWYCNLAKFGSNYMSEIITWNMHNTGLALRFLHSVETLNTESPKVGALDLRIYKKVYTLKIFT